jgi:hypothetical protein
MAGAPLYHMEDPGVPYHMHDTDTKKQCEKMKRTATSAGLTKSRICRSFPTSLIHAGSEAFGAELPHLFTFRCISRLSNIVYHITGRSITSLLLQAALEAALKEAGLGPYPWHPDFKAVLQVHHQDLDKISHVLYVRQLHRSSPQHQDGWILTERPVPHGKLHKTGSLLDIIN